MQSDTPTQELTPTEEKPAGPGFWRVISSTWLGVGLVTALAVLYGVLTLVEFYAGPKSTLPQVGSLYAHWTVVTLTFLACGNLVFATVRIPLDWHRLGAWCSHLGLMFLVIGSVYFWRTRTEGQCFIARNQNDSWPVVRHFFRSTDKVACHVYNTRAMQSGSTLPPTVQTVFDSPTGLEPVDINVPLKGTPNGVSVTATKIYPRAQLRQQWSNESEAFSLGVEIEVSHGHQSDRTIMCQTYDDTVRFDMPECSVFFQATPVMSKEEMDRYNASSDPAKKMTREFFAIHYTGNGNPMLLIGDASGNLSTRPFEPGQSVSTSHKNHPTSIKLIRTLNRALRVMSPEVPPASKPGRLDAAIELTINADGRTIKRVVRYGAYLSGRPTIINLPSGQRMYIAFSGEWLELPEPIKIVRHEFKTAPASRMPEDYICDMDIGSGVHTRKATLKLNFPISIGSYRLHQSTWQPKAETPSNYNDPAAIVLGVADRPGIWLIFVGSIMLCAGFPYAFYIKPLILRARVKAKIKAAAEADERRAEL
ncbi:MAG: hypothetical protein HN350_00510 [Phycisphaerales bacterium]|jgi:hypothetical protein|nr:hypothetical protein [Phycisphaerales bacterium]